MSLTRFALPTLAFVLALAACSPAEQPGGSSVAQPRTIAVSMTDELRFEPASFTVQAGETVRFVVSNEGQVVHEFLIGDEEDQARFEGEMGEMDGIEHDSEAGVSVQPGSEEEFNYIFAVAGELLAGCHEPGHFAGGMVATLSIEG